MMHTDVCELRAAIEHRRAAVAMDFAAELEGFQIRMRQEGRFPTQFSRVVDQRRAERERLRMRLLEHEAKCTICRRIEPGRQSW